MDNGSSDRLDRIEAAIEGMLRVQQTLVQADVNLNQRVSSLTMALESNNAHLTASIQQSIASQHRHNAQVNHALEALAEQQVQLTLTIDGLSQKMGDIHTLAISNREILAEMRRDREGNSDREEDNNG